MEESAAQLTFFIPTALAESAPHASSPFACLETLIARGTTTRTSVTADAQLLALFGGESRGGTARAAVSHFARHDMADVERWRIIATPVHLLTDHATLHLPVQQQSLLSEKESRALMASCQEHFAEEGWQLEYGDVNAWYLQLSDATEITTTSLEQAAGRPLIEQLPQGRDAKVWRRWSNEVQMLFHGHPVNEARHNRGEPLVNSLWFWGEGPLPSLPARHFAHVMGGDRFVQGLAKLCGAHWSSLAYGLTVLDEALLKGPTLIVLDEADPSSWDELWFSPLQKMVQRKSVKRAVLHFSSGHTTKLTSAQLWRLWRRKHLAVTGRGTAS